MELYKNIIQQFYYILSIFIFFIFLFMYYNFTHNENYAKYLKSTSMSLNDLIMELINPDCENKDKAGVELSMLYKSVCSNGKSIDDFNFLEYILFIFLGAGIVCYEINEKMLNYAGEIIYNAGNIGSILENNKKIPEISVNSNSSPLMDEGTDSSLPTSKNSKLYTIFRYTLLPIFLLYLFLDFITTIVKERFIELYKMFGNKFNSVNKNNKEKMYIGKEISKSFLALITSVIVGIIIVNCIAYVLFLAKGMTSSNTSKITYFAILLALPFVLSTVNINLTVIEGNKNSKNPFKKNGPIAKNPATKSIGKTIKKDPIGKAIKKDPLGKVIKKDPLGKAIKKNNKKESEKRKKHKERNTENFAAKPVTCTSYNYIWYFVGYFIVPICITIYTIFKFLFVGLVGISQIFTKDFASRILWLIIATIPILIFVFLSELLEFYYTKLIKKTNKAKK